MKKLIARVAVLLFAVSLAAQSPATGSTRAVGAVESVSGNSFTLKTDAGAEITVSASEGTRVLRSEPGQKSLKEASPATMADLQAGDRAIASGQGSPDGKSITATTIVVMKKTDIANKQAQDRQDWQRRGVGGLVSKVDGATSTVTLTTANFGQKKEVAVHITPTTVIRRYASDSVKFDDARKSTLAEIKPGDQMRARGEKNSQGTEITAEEVVSGAFRNLAGTVQSVDKDKKQITLVDLATKKPVTIAVGADSLMRKLPEMMAQHIAARLKGGATPQGGQPGHGPGGTPAGAPTGPQAAAGSPGEHGGFGQNGGMRNGNSGDMLQQVLNRAPAVQLEELQKGDAVMVVATEGSASSAPTVITLLTGVDPILSASPKGSDASTILSPWNLGGGGGGGDLSQ